MAVGDYNLLQRIGGLGLASEDSEHAISWHWFEAVMRLRAAQGNSGSSANSVLVSLWNLQPGAQQNQATALVDLLDSAANVTQKVARLNRIQSVLGRVLEEQSVPALSPYWQDDGAGGYEPNYTQIQSDLGI